MMIQEIRDIPEKARLCYSKNRNIQLPERVPYIGMGSSYFAPLVMKYLGCDIIPEIASEYYHYLSGSMNYTSAVLLSQSGYSSETIWNIDSFEQCDAVVNDPESPLAKSGKVNRVIELHAGEEKHSATKTYINTLVTLYLGLGLDCVQAITTIKQNMKKYEDWGEQRAGIIHKKLKSDRIKGIYVIGSGPNLATACQAALILTETTKIPFIPMALPQYDHGPKESSDGTIVIPILTDGPVRERSEKLVKKISNAGATVLSWKENNVPEKLSPLTSIIPVNYLAYALSVKLKIGKTFTVGGKVTIVDKDQKD